MYETKPLTRWRRVGAVLWRLEWKLVDLWIGAFWTPQEAWVCLLPCLPIYLKQAVELSSQSTPKGDTKQMSESINIAGMDKATILAALYNNAGPQGRGYLVAQQGDMTIEQARALLERGTSFDYIQGRVLKVRLSGDTFDPWLYDRDNGEGKAARVIDALR